MRTTLFIFFLGYLTYGQTIDKYLWKNRLVIIFKTADNNLQVREQLGVLKPLSSQIKDRDMIILVPEKAEKLNLLERFRLNRDYSGLILVGKDGKIKLKQELGVKPQRLFSLIDTMPMRRAEVKKKSKKRD